MGETKYKMHSTVTNDTFQVLYTGRVKEGAAAGTSICQVTAFDSDEGANGEVTYSIDCKSLTSFYI